MKNLIIFDLDGTLADCTHRLHHLEKEVKDWQGFFAACDGDAIIPHTAALFYLIRHNPNYETWIVSGRSDVVRPQTQKWLLDHHLHPDKLIMRPMGDHREDDVLKAEWLDNADIPRDRILMIFEDRQRVVDMWRAHDLPVMQVAKGAF